MTLYKVLSHIEIKDNETVNKTLEETTDVIKTTNLPLERLETLNDKRNGRPTPASYMV